MAGELVSGPPGSGKSQYIRQRLLDRGAAPAVAVDFQAVYAALLLLERGVGGRYPERDPAQAYAIPLTEYVRRAAITGALARGLFIWMSNADGDPARRQDLLGLLGPNSRETVIDPGIETITDRLSVNGELSDQCREARDRWYLRRGQ